MTYTNFISFLDVETPLFHVFSPLLFDFVVYSWIGVFYFRRGGDGW
jgi:hypothetical protein